MAIELFQIEWTKPYPFDKALSQPETKEGGVYAMYKSTGASKRLYYIGKSVDFGSRFGFHKQATSHMMSEAERRKCFICFGLISSFEKSRMSNNITSVQLKNIESFLINKLQPIGCGESTKRRYTGDYPMIVVNIGKVTKPFEKVMSHSPELLKILGKATKTERKPSDSGWTF